MDRELMKNLQLLDFMGVEFQACRNIDRLVNTDMAYFRLKKLGEKANDTFKRIFRE